MKKKYPANRKRAENIMIKVTREEKQAIHEYVFASGESSVGAWFRKLAQREINGGTNQ